jgi:N-acetylmuramoyl-L-alanine amidase
MNALKFFATVGLLAAIVACGSGVPQKDPVTLERVAFTAANAVLQSQTNIRVLAVRLQDTQIQLSFSQMPDDQTVDTVVRSVALALEGQFSHLEFAFVAQKPKENLLRSLALCAGATMFSGGGPGIKPTSVSTAKIVLNPGHGWTAGSGFQRQVVNPNAALPVFVQEDLNNLEMALAVKNSVAITGATVLGVRNFDQNAGNGVSGFPKWQEDARTHLQGLGVPAGVWDSERDATDGNCSLEKDIRARALYANSVAADALVGLHTNAGSISDYQTALGTLTFYSTQNFWPDAPTSWVADSRNLAEKIHQAVVTSIRANRSDLNWPSGMVVGVPSGSFVNYGELRFSKVPAVLVEAGFHTNPIDGPALGQASFRAALAQGIKAGLEAHFGAAAPQAPVWQATPASINFGAGNVGSSLTASLTLKNNGSTGSYSITSNDAGLGSTSSGGTLAAGASTNISLTASCSIAGTKAAALTISGGGLSVQVAANWSCSNVVAPPVVPVTPSPLTVSMSSNGRMLLTWPEVPGGAFYEFKATFDNTDLDVAGRAQSKGGVYGGAVATFTENPSAADKNGKTVCFAIRALNASNSPSLFSGFSCTPYRYYTNGLTIQSSSDNQILLSPK